MRQTFIIKFKDGIAEESCYHAWTLLADYLEEKGVLEKLQEALPRMSRVWIEVLTIEGVSRCTGFATLAQVWDVGSFHCDDERTRARLMQRIAVVLEESAGERTTALVHVDPAIEDKWIPMLESMGAQRVSRWVVPTSAELLEGGQNVLRPIRDSEKLPQHALEFDSSADSETK